jgi:hypothetical protein
VEVSGKLASLQVALTSLAKLWTGCFLYKFNLLPSQSQSPSPTQKQTSAKSSKFMALTTKEESPGIQAVEKQSHCQTTNCCQEAHPVGGIRDE